MYYKIQNLQCLPIKYKEKTVWSTPGVQDYRDFKLQKELKNRGFCLVREFLRPLHIGTVMNRKLYLMEIV